LNKEDRINEVIDDLYKAISCEPGSILNEKALKALFTEDSILVELDNENVKYKSIDDHIQEMKHAFEMYGFLKEYGFLEKEVKRIVIDNGRIVMISSTYEKKYHNGKRQIVENGVNNICMIDNDGKLKIVSIAWEN